MHQPGMVACWQEELAVLDFTVCHRPGTQNTNADALSRGEDIMPALTTKEEAEQAEYIHHRCQLGEQLSNTGTATAATPSIRLDPEQVFAAQTQDFLLLNVRQPVRSPRD